MPRLCDTAHLGASRRYSSDVALQCSDKLASGRGAYAHLQRNISHICTCKWPSFLFHMHGNAMQVKQYFNTTGFERWNKIYGETDEVNKVQLDIRNVRGRCLPVFFWSWEPGPVYACKGVNDMPVHGIRSFQNYVCLRLVEPMYARAVLARRQCKDPAVQQDPCPTFWCCPGVCNLWDPGVCLLHVSVHPPAPSHACMYVRTRMCERGRYTCALCK